MKPTPVALLVRVSTSQQDTARQLTELSAVAASRGWDVVATVEEAGVSGSAKKRPGLAKVIELAEAGTIRKVLVHEVSRVARRNSVAHTFLDRLEELGVSLYWHAQGIETLLANGKRNPAAAIMFSLLSEMARSEKETLIERTKSGLAEARRRGVTLGRPVGTKTPAKVMLTKHADIARHLRAGHSIRHVAAITSKAKATVEKVKKLLDATRPTGDSSSA